MIFQGLPAGEDAQKMYWEFAEKPVVCLTVLFVIFEVSDANQTEGEDPSIYYYIGAEWDYQ